MGNAPQSVLNKNNINVSSKWIRNKKAYNYYPTKKLKKMWVGQIRSKKEQQVKKRSLRTADWVFVQLL